jgi:hypothetical protein
MAFYREPVNIPKGRSLLQRQSRRVVFLFQPNLNAFFSAGEVDQATYEQELWWPLTGQ